MPDLDWERSIPIYEMNRIDILNILLAFDSTIELNNYYTISLGCRNSNYVLDTNNGKLLLRVTGANEFNNELAAHILLKDRVKLPDLLFHINKSDRIFYIYEFIDSVSLQKKIIETGACPEAYIRQVAIDAAVIHNTPLDRTSGIKELDVPPFEVWYDCFLSNPIVRDRMGTELYEAVKHFINARRELIPVIDCYQAFIHSDFRPANMLVTEDDQIFIVDWEYACTGHVLADIGQFFRYRKFFSVSDFELFERVYNEYAKTSLPEDWIELSLFRDLVNPLQMLSSTDHMPIKHRDLIEIVRNTIS